MEKASLQDIPDFTHISDTFCLGIFQPGFGRMLSTSSSQPVQMSTLQNVHVGKANLSYSQSATSKGKVQKCKGSVSGVGCYVNLNTGMASCKSISGKPRYLYGGFDNDAQHKDWGGGCPMKDLQGATYGRMGAAKPIWKP